MLGRNWVPAEPHRTKELAKGQTGGCQSGGSYGRHSRHRVATAEVPVGRRQLLRLSSNVDIYPARRGPRLPQQYLSADGQLAGTQDQFSH